MAEMLSPGVFVEEIDASQIVPTVSASVAVFGGNFVKGPVGAYNLISSVSDLIDYYGKPTKTNYNDWYQCYNFLQYGNNLLISRACNENGASELLSGVSVVQVGVEVATGAEVDSAEVDNAEVADVTLDLTKVKLTKVSTIAVGNVLVFGEGSKRYLVTEINTDDKVITLDREIDAEKVVVGDTVSLVEFSFNGSNETVDDQNVTEQEIVFDDDGNTAIVKIPDSISAADLFETNKFIKNFSDFEEKEDSIAFAKPSMSKLKFISKNSGAWCKNLKICIATPDSFEANDTSENHVPHYAFEGLSVDDYFEYAPQGDEFGILIYDDEQEEVVEVFTVSMDPDAKDQNNKSLYVETVINRQSQYVYVKVNTSNKDALADYTLTYDVATEKYVGKNLTLLNSSDSDIQADDLLDAYELFDNKEEIDIDIVIANELDGGVSAKNLVTTRLDCIAFIGAPRELLVGQKAVTCTKNMVNWRKNGALNYNSMFCVGIANYKYQYDRYSDKYRWINLAGDIAGLRAQTSANRASWWASAGLDRGQIQNAAKLAFNPTLAMRDMLYKNGLNPIVTFPGQGTVCWGQKTLLDKASSFDRVNVRGLFNTLERALSKMAKYQVFEFNDNYTRNRIISMIKPYLSTVQAGRGIQDFLVVCDESNNTADIISRNQLVVDIYIKPTYVAEFILLRFTNAGTNSFSEVIGG